MKVTENLPLVTVALPLYTTLSWSLNVSLVPMMVFTVRGLSKNVTQVMPLKSVISFPSLS